MMRMLLNTLLLTALVSWPVLAAVDAYTFNDPAKEAEFKHLIKELRCPKCQNQDIGDSDAQLAKDLRDKVYQMIQQGKSREEIIDYMKARYGDFVHYQPPVRMDTIILWLGPMVVLVAGLIFIFVRASRETSPALTEEERQRLARLLDEEDQQR
ncbi:cytochrome c-type biogenesis protein [Gallaecimonas sp. GXIMD1310]|uniref:cytochrome c-type biogenesis protein n=1 Tax=Gallaecimonas sp. GXIMD1310 TaxID=3131926 RepID=UPI003246B776